MAEKNDTQTSPPDDTPKKSTSRASITSDDGDAGSSTSAATAAVTSTVKEVRQKLQSGEQLVLTGAGLVALVWIIFDLIFDYRTVSTFTLLIAVFALLAIYIHRWGHHDFGSGYRVLIGALGIALAFFAVTDFLITIRTGISAGALQLVGLLLFWVGGVVAGYGGWLVFRSRDL